MDTERHNALVIELRDGIEKLRATLLAAPMTEGTRHDVREVARLLDRRLAKADRQLATMIRREPGGE